MTLAGLSAAGLEAQLAAGLRLRMGPFNVCIHADEATLAQHITAHYPDYELAADDAFCHAGVHVGVQRTLPRVWAEQGYVRLDDGALFTDFQPGEGLPYLEWAINWCIATRCHFYLMLHAAVVEKAGVALIMPGLPGAGKSTLSAYLAHNGWRLLSDEFCLLRPGTCEVIPFPRLIPLKNESIEVIRQAVGDARIGPSFAGTRKGTVAHVAPPAAHTRCAEPAQARVVVKPQYVAGAAAELTDMAAAQCFVELSNNAFNYQILGREGFDTVAALARSTQAYQLRYGDLEQARDALQQVVEALPPAQ